MKLAMRVLLVVLSGLLFSANTYAVEVDTSEFIHETQRINSSNGELDLVWWIPNEYWTLITKNDPSKAEGGAQNHGASK